MKGSEEWGIRRNQFIGKERKNMLIMVSVVLAASFLAFAFAVMVVSAHFSRLQYHMLNTICGELLKQEPDLEGTLSQAIKKYRSPKEEDKADDMGGILSRLGYRVSDFTDMTLKQNVLSVLVGFAAGFLLFGGTLLYLNKKKAARIQALTNYLDQLNAGKAVPVFSSEEDDFSKLEDEIGKTVTSLNQTKDAAVEAKNNFAENLSNIAHQIKTPITAISLSVQVMREEQEREQLIQIQKQLLRLSHLEEALLVISRLDAGTLVLQKEEVDVFTLLVLAADNLQELFTGTGTSVDIPELGEMAVTADLDWTMEAVMNLMKNGMEHNPGGTIHCSYLQNPLYTEILIWDEGSGFLKEEIPHLFERFYRGKNAGQGGIGIGLALAKEIVERQNGTIRAKNLPGSGACFEIRLYHC